MAANGTYSTDFGYATYTILLPPVTVPTSTKSTVASPTPTAEVLIIWDVPPVTGPVFYDFYKEALGFTASLDNNCGDIVNNDIPFWEPNDPKQGRVDGDRPAAGIPRQPPGKLGTLPIGKACVYEEDVLNTGTITCTDSTWTCAPPASALAGDVEPNNGACSGIDYVRTLVMVSLL